MVSAVTSLMNKTETLTFAELLIKLMTNCHLIPEKCEF